jgi:hypothetical protein
VAIPAGKINGGKMRDPRDPGGEYDRDAGFGVYLADDARPWTSEDYVDYVLNHRIQREKSIHELVHEEITSRHVVGKVNHDRPFTKDTYEDNLQQAIEEAADMLFYLIALRESIRAK